jgi:hypothetical protein
MTEHHWTETDWDTVTIGFVTNLDPGFYNNQQAQAKFQSILKKNMTAPQSWVDTKPKFQNSK